MDDRDRGTIRRANLDGSQVETIITGLEHPEGLDIDEGAGKIYWAEWGRIGRANLNGSQVETIGSVWGADIALDVDGGKAYLAFGAFFIIESTVRASTDPQSKPSSPKRRSFQAS